MHPLTLSILCTPSSSLFILKGKSQEAYAWVLSSMVRDSGLDLRTAKSDYEIALMKALRDEFARESNSHETQRVDGCAFHFKQANRRKLIDLRVPKHLVSALAGKEGLLNFLTVINYEEIPKAIAYIRHKLPEGAYKSTFDQYWAYFNKTWMKRTSRYDDKTGIFLFTSWNMSHLLNSDGGLAEDEDGIDVMVNRTIIL